MANLPAQTAISGLPVIVFVHDSKHFDPGISTGPLVSPQNVQHAKLSITVHLNLGFRRMCHSVDTSAFSKNTTNKHSVVSNIATRLTLGVNQGTKNDPLLM